MLSMKVHKSRWDVPPKVVESNRAKILCELRFQTEKLLLVNQLDIVVVDREQKRAVGIDVAIPADSNIRKIKHERIEKSN